MKAKDQYHNTLAKEGCIPIPKTLTELAEVAQKISEASKELNSKCPWLKIGAKSGN